VRRAAARAEWVRRVTDGIMGTRITVEVWAEDAGKGNQAIDAVLDENAAHRRDHEHLQADQRGVAGQRQSRADGPMHISKEPVRPADHRSQYSEITDGAFDIHLRGVGICTTSASTSVRRRRDRPGAAGRQLSARDPRSGQPDVRFSQKGVRIDLGGIAKAIRSIAESMC